VIVELDYEDRQIVLQVLKGRREVFTDDQFDVLLMSIVGFTQEDVAQALGVNQSTVSRKLRRALDKAHELAINLA